MGKSVRSNVSFHRLPFIRVNFYMQYDECIGSSVLLNNNLFPYGKIQSFVRRSRPGVFCKKGVVRDFAKFTGE